MAAPQVSCSFLNFVRSILIVHLCIHAFSDLPLMLCSVEVDAVKDLYGSAVLHL